MAGVTEKWAGVTGRFVCVFEPSIAHHKLPLGLDLNLIKGPRIGVGIEKNHKVRAVYHADQAGLPSVRVKVMTNLFLGPDAAPIKSLLLSEKLKQTLGFCLCRETDDILALSV